MFTGVVVPDALRGRAERPPSLQVLVVGAGGVLTEALTRLLLASGVAAVHTGDDQLEMALARHRPEAVLLEGGLGSDRLVECAELVGRGCPAARVLLLAAGDEDDALLERLHVAAVLSAWSAPEELLRTIRGAPGVRRKGRDRRPVGDDAHRERPHVPPHSRVSQLTVREFQILRTLMAGASSSDVAGALTISPHTVRTHVQNILAKLNARTRLEAVTIGFREGLRPLGDLRPGRTGGSEGRLGAPEVQEDTRR